MLTIDGTSIERVSELRFLGVILDDGMTCKEKNVYKYLYIKQDKKCVGLQGNANSILCTGIALYQLLTGSMG